MAPIAAPLDPLVRMQCALAARVHTTRAESISWQACLSGTLLHRPVCKVSARRNVRGCASVGAAFRTAPSCSALFMTDHAQNAAGRDPANAGRLGLGDMGLAEGTTLLDADDMATRGIHTCYWNAEE